MSERHVSLRDVPHAIEDLERLPVRGPGGQVFALGELAAIHPEEDSRGALLPAQRPDRRSPSRCSGRPAPTPSRPPRRARRARPDPEDPPARACACAIERDESVDLDKELERPAAARCDCLRCGAARADAHVARCGTAPAWCSAAPSSPSPARHSVSTSSRFPRTCSLSPVSRWASGFWCRTAWWWSSDCGWCPTPPDARAAPEWRSHRRSSGRRLTTAVVLFPFLYLQGNARAAFMPFAAAFTLALFWSVITALVLVPAVGTAAMERREAGRGWRHVYDRARPPAPLALGHDRAHAGAGRRDDLGLHQEGAAQQLGWVGRATTAPPSPPA